MLQNAAYIGHWIENNTIVRYNNHPGIVPTDTFFQVFNYLSPIGLDGGDNPNYRSIRQYSRPDKDARRPVEEPLCAGLIVTKVQDKWVKAGLQWRARQQKYVYAVVDSSGPCTKKVWRKNAVYVDDEIAKLVRLKLSTTFAPDEWDKRVEEMAEEYKARKNQILAQRQALEQAMQGQIASLGVLVNVDLIKAIEVSYTHHQAEYKRLSNAVDAIEYEAQRLDAAFTLRLRAGAVFAGWDQAIRDEKVNIFHAFIDKIEAIPDGHHALRLIVHWRDNTREEIALTKLSNMGPNWSTAELERLTRMANEGRSQLDIAAAFPRRTWGAIRKRALALTGKNLLATPSIVGYDETFEEYQAGLSNHEVKVNTGSAARWGIDDSRKLTELLNSGASSIEILAAFPGRRWQNIRNKITSVYGKDRTPKTGGIRHGDTIATYQARQARTCLPEAEVDASSKSAAVANATT